MTSKIIPFTRPRSYLDACREQGVFQSHEEMLAENHDLKSRLSNVRKDHTATVVKLVGSSPNAAGLAMAEQRTQMLLRFGQFLDAFLAQGLTVEWVPLLRHLVVDTETPGDQAAALFRAASTPTLSNQEEH